MKEKEWFCKKHPEFSSEGVCWKIIKPDLENEQIEKKYCQNKKQPDLIRRYERIGYVIIQPNDKCITKHCSICGQEALLNIDETKCCYCRYVY